MFEPYKLNDTKSRMRVRYLPLEDVIPGMALVDAARDRFQRILYPAGTVMDQECLYEMSVNMVRYVCVSFEDLRAAEIIATDTAVSVHRLLDIFEYADLTDPVMADFFNQVLTYRSS